MLIYFWNRLLKKSRGVAIKKSQIHKTSKIGSGTQMINSAMDKHSFCGYDCKILNCSIGAFCSIADKVVIGGAEHPVNWVSTSPVFYVGRDSIKKKYSEYPREAEKRTIIGNDVWIGENVLIKAGVTIGDGAVVGMGSIVTKDVEAYSIVVGNPAKLIRRRFEADVCTELCEMKWWNLEEELLQHLSPYIQEPRQFIEVYKKFKEGNENG